MVFVPAECDPLGALELETPRDGWLQLGLYGGLAKVGDELVTVAT